MPIYKCPKCDYTTKVKQNIAKHCSKKNACKNEIVVYNTENAVTTESENAENAENAVNNEVDDNDNEKEANVKLEHQPIQNILSLHNNHNNSRQYFPTLNRSINQYQSLSMRPYKIAY